MKRMDEMEIRVTLQNNGRGEEAETDVPVLSILSVSEVWEWMRATNPDGTQGRANHVYLGTHIASHRDFGWLVKERAQRVEQLINDVTKWNKHYSGECSCPCAGSIYSNERKKRAV